MFLASLSGLALYCGIRVYEENKRLGNYLEFSVDKLSKQSGDNIENNYLVMKVFCKHLKGFIISWLTILPVA